MVDYEFIDHTADVGVRAYGKTLEEAFSNAGRAMFAIITDDSVIASSTKISFKLDYDDYEQLLVDFLDELLFHNGAHNLIFGRFDIRIKDGSLYCIAYGEDYDLDKHNRGVEIKAVTYHILEVRTEAPIHVQVLFDI